MGCRNREVSDDESPVSGSLSEALLFTTMCIIGLPVEVHVKDGSVYSGIFYTACVEKDYGIVLKKARMTKKGKSDANVANGGLIETLVVLSGDLVQVVAKGVLLSSDGVVENVAGDNVEAVAGTLPSSEHSESEARKTKSSKFVADKKKMNQIRRSAQNENGSARGFMPTDLEGEKMAPSYIGDALEVESGKRDGIHVVKSEEATIVPVNRQVRDDRSQGNQDEYKENFGFHKGENTHEVQSSRSSSDGYLTEVKLPEEIHAKMRSKPLANGVSCDSSAPSFVKQDTLCYDQYASADTPSSDGISSDVSTSSSSAMDTASESGLSSWATPPEMVPPKSSASNRSAKEFKLNPGARIFSPSFTNPRSASPPAVSTVASMAYIPNNSPVVPAAAAQPEVGVSPYAPRPSLPVKVVPYPNLAAGNGGSGSQYSQPIVGHMGSRTHSVRYAGQYHPVQTGSTYVHPNSQAVMVGRSGQLFYVHPVSHDVIQGAAVISPVPARPLLTPHQVQFPKHQGAAAAQAFQLCVPPPFVGSGQQPFAVPSQLPLLQPPFPANRSIAIPGSNGLFSVKFP